MGKIIAVANQKGGVGKTTTCVNLSACLAFLGKKILVVDIDPQGNTTSGFGYDKQRFDYSIYDAIINDMPMDEIMAETDYENLHICPANINLAGAEIELVNKDRREFKLKEALEQVKDSYDFIFIDCPPSLGLITINVFTAADTVLIPIQCEYYALEGLSQLTNTIKQIRNSLNENLDIEGILLTMFDARTNLSVQVVDEVKKYLKSKVYSTIIPRNVRLSEAPSFGKPVIVYDKYSKGAESYMDLANEIIGGKDNG